MRICQYHFILYLAESSQFQYIDNIEVSLLDELEVLVVEILFSSEDNAKRC